MSEKAFFCKAHQKEVSGKCWRRKRIVGPDLLTYVNELCRKKNHPPNVTADDVICNTCFIAAFGLKRKMAATSTETASSYPTGSASSSAGPSTAITTTTTNITTLRTAITTTVPTSDAAIIATADATTTTTVTTADAATTTTITTADATTTTTSTADNTCVTAAAAKTTTNTTPGASTTTTTAVASTTTSTTDASTSISSNVTTATTTTGNTASHSSATTLPTTDAASSIVASSIPTAGIGSASSTTTTSAKASFTRRFLQARLPVSDSESDFDLQMHPLQESFDNDDQNIPSSGTRHSSSFTRRDDPTYVPNDGDSSDSEAWEDEDDDDDIIHEENNYVFTVRAPPNTGKHCFICKSTEDRHAISKTAMALLYIELRVFVPSECRVCLKHLVPDKERFTEDAVREIEKLENLKSYVLKEHEMNKLVDTTTMLASKPRVDFSPYGYYKDEEYVTLTGLTRSQFNELFAFLTPHLNRKWRFGSRVALALTLTKLHTGMSQELLGLLFKMSQSTVSRTIRQVCKQLHEKFVPLHLGYQHITREDYIRLHHTDLASTLCEVDGTQCIYVMDGTYFFCGKSSNFDAQRGLFSGQKGVPLCKSMIICSPSGYMLAVEGMYKSNGRNNDASITKDMVQKDGGFLSFVKENDLIIWDRGFRDASRLAAYYGLNTRMPHVLQKTAKQHTDLEANDSRITTSIRWVVESVNSRLKRKWKFLDGRIENTYLPHLGKYVEVCAALTNAFCPPLARNRPHHIQMAQEMLARRHLSNMILEGLNSKQIVPASKRSKWKLIEETDMIDFPYLSIEDLRAITFGIYQIKLARSYTAEHMDDLGHYPIYSLNMSGHTPADDKLIRVKIRSRHTQIKKYDIYIQYSPTKVNDSAITGWYCTCKAGARVLGCCAHVCSVLYYLGFQRYDPTLKPPAQNIDKNIRDAAQRETTPESESAAAEIVPGGSSAKQKKSKKANEPKRKRSTAKRSTSAKRGRGRPVRATSRPRPSTSDESLSTQSENSSNSEASVQ